MYLNLCAKNNKVLLGMSGGIDSSVAAILLKAQGYDVIGVTFVFNRNNEQNIISVNEAKNLAKKFHIKHFVVDLHEEFEQLVVQYFINEYTNGHTPFPCAVCNPLLKFKYLNKYSIIENCDYIATGHYVKTGLHNGKKYLFEGNDPEKDQTFFLWGLYPEIVDKLLFPLGELCKYDVRLLASKNGFSKLTSIKESFGICFIDGNNYRNFFKNRGIKSNIGNFVDTSGNILGKHKGIINYTVGQRRGLGLNFNFPLFVSEIRVDSNEIVLAKYDDLYCSKLFIYNYYIIDNELINSGTQLTVKVRYRLQETLCSLNILSDTDAVAELYKPEAMIAPGQTAVFYDGDRLVGGGFIKSSE